MSACETSWNDSVGFVGWTELKEVSQLGYTTHSATCTRETDSHVRPTDADAIPQLTISRPIFIRREKSLPSAAEFPLIAKMFSTMKTLLLLVTLLATANAERKSCTAEQMEGLQIVGYAFKRVFRFTKYTEFLHLEDVLFKTLKYSDLTSGDIGHLVHLHQGFDRKLILLQYGMHDKDYGISGDRVKYLKENLYFHSEPKLAVIDDASVDSREVVQMKWSRSDCSCITEASKDFASFVYGHRVYYEGGYADIRQERPSYFKFVSNASDLCADVKYPVVDIAVDPPICYSRMLNETAESSVGDEWIVSLVDGIRTTRSTTLCDQLKPTPMNFPIRTGELILPNNERFCYYLKKPGMKTPCFFAGGSKYLFPDVQVEPANPVRMAKKVPSTTNSPLTTESAPEASSGQTSTETEQGTSGATTTSRLFCGFSLLCFLCIL